MHDKMKTRPISICRKFLSEHAPKKAEGETPGKPDSKPVSPAQMLYAKKIDSGNADGCNNAQHVPPVSSNLKIASKQ